MKAEKKRKRLRVAGIFLAAILPVLLILLGIVLLLGDAVITGWFIVTYLVLPLTAFGGCVLVIRTGYGPVMKVILCAVLTVLMVVLLMAAMSLGHYAIYSMSNGEEAVLEYQRDTDDIDIMPTIEELGQPEYVEYHYYYNQVVTIFESDCYMLFCRYAEEDYELQQDLVDQRYIFQEDALSSRGYSVEPDFVIDGYHFRLLSFVDGEYDLIYPKYMMLIGTNDETNEVVYLYYDDDDLDYIESMEDHMMNNFGWKYIR